MNVLLIEDNPGDARLIETALAGASGPPFHVETAERLSGGLARLREATYDVALLDLGLPDSQGLETLAATLEAAQGVPFVVLTIAEDDAVAVRAVQMGAQDYLVKGQLDPSLLGRTLRYAVERHRLMTELERRLEWERRQREREQQLRQANAELDAFAHTVSHDLKEPLRAIEAFSGFLLEDYADRIDEQGRDYLAMTGKAATRMKRLIDDLLALAAVGGAVAGPVRVDVAGVIAAIVEGMRITMDERGAEVEVHRDLPEVLGEPSRVEQIFSNLIANGLKFNTNAKPRVSIGVRCARNGTATFYVQDNGIGIDPAHHEKVFGVFQRLNRREDYEGTGAGLSIAKRAVQSLGGEISVESQLGAGATFLFALPLWRDGAGEASR